MIVDTITDMSRLYRDLKKMNRENFSYQGARALMEWLDEDEPGGEPIEYDPIAFCCTYSEYSDVQECLDEYDLETQEDLLDRTHVIHFAGGIIVEDF